MKTIYIPKGETVHYESLSTEHLIVEGTLEVTYGVVAKQIDGDGVIHAGTVEADIIRIRCIETARTVCRRLIAKVWALWQMSRQRGIRKCITIPSPMFMTICVSA